MLTNERYDVIMKLLAEKQTVKITDLMEATGVSESTIRRDLNELESMNKLERLHGGATIRERNIQELSVSAKSTKDLQEKIRIASFASTFVQQGDFIYLDAGTTTFQMIPFLKDQDITVVTNGLTHVESLMDFGITTYLVGGFVKSTTHALVGPQALKTLSEFRFDQCFLGVNGYHLEFGYTTPDPQEAAVKKMAAGLARKTYVLADHTKYNKVSFAKIMDLDQAELLVGDLAGHLVNALQEKTTVKVGPSQ